MNGADANTSEQVVAAIRATKVGDYVHLQVWSSGTKHLVNIKVAERPADQPTAPQPTDTP